MNIAVFTGYFYPHEGGVENYVLNLFGRLSTKGNNIIIITSNTENSKRYEKVTIKGYKFEIYRLECWHLLNNTYPLIKPGYKKILNKIKDVDIVITNTRFFHTSLIGVKYAINNNIPNIHIEHGTTHSPIPNPVLRQAGIIYDHTIGKYIISHSNKCMGVSKKSCEFIKHISKNIKEENIGVILNGVDTSKFKKISKTKQLELKNSLKIKKTEKIITFVGRTIYAKGIQDLFEATENIKNIKILIIGDGNYKKTLMKKYSLRDNIIFLGTKTHSEIIEYLSITDIFVNPSYAEGLPTSVLEAGAMSVAVIATNVGGTNEIINNGVSGYLVNPKDTLQLNGKILKLLTNNRLRRSLGTNIHKKITKLFDWDKISKELGGILSEHTNN